MNILVAGATGFTGSHVVQLLLKEDVKIHCFVRKTSDLQHLPRGDIQLRYGDLADKTSLMQALTPIDVFVNVASLGFGHAQGIVDAAVQSGVPRTIFISTTAIFTQLNANSKAIRLAAEKAICQSDLAYTILRPTMIYGSQRDRNICRLIQFLKRWPLIPIFGDGNHLQQPVYVGDVATAVVQAIKHEQTIRKSYNIPGSSPITYNDLIDTVCNLLKHRVQKLHIPKAMVTNLLGTAERIGLPMPIKAEQVLRLNEDKAFDYTDAQRDFAYAPLSFREGIARELAELR